MQEIVKVTRKKNLKLWLAPGKLATKILLGVALVLVVILFWVVFIYGRNTFDQRTFEFIRPHITTSRTAIMNFISFLGKHSFLIPLIFGMILVFVFLKKYKMAIRMSVILLTSLLLMSLLKRMLQRPRPADPLVDGITNFSFPSGHAFMAVAFYGLLAWLAAIYITRRWLQRLVISGLIALILGIGFSRIYLRVHYATDVIAGLCIGFLWLSFTLWFMDKKQTVTKTTITISADTQNAESSPSK